MLAMRATLKGFSAARRDPGVRRWFQHDDAFRPGGTPDSSRWWSDSGTTGKRHPPTHLRPGGAGEATGKTVAAPR